MLVEGCHYIKVLSQFFGKPIHALYPNTTTTIGITLRMLPTIKLLILVIVDINVPISIILEWVQIHISTDTIFSLAPYTSILLGSSRTWFP